MTHRLNRRAFVQLSAAGAASLLILRDSGSARGYVANEKLNIALVGVGTRGQYHAWAIPHMGQNLAALCDANFERAAETFAKFPDVPKFRDFRQMLDQHGKSIDALVIATPDHTHAVIAATAMKQGKHVYVEKPIAHDVSEARRLRALAHEYRVATQMGNQGMATDSFRRTLELVQQGAVGEIREVHAWYVFGGSGPQQRPTEQPEVPETVDWDLWLGPAPYRPYHPSYLTSWWAWRDFGTGVLGGGGSHNINLTFKGLRLGSLWESAQPGGAPIRVEAEIPEPSPENFPRWEMLRFHMPARGDLPPVCIHWYAASEAHLKETGTWQKLEQIAGRPLEWKDDSWTPQSGTLLVGSKGVVHTNAHNSVCALLPAEKFPDAGGPPQTIPRAGSHEREWIAACKGGASPLSCFDHSGPAIELMLLGNIATLVNRPLEFDPVACRIANDEEADRALRPVAREGWEF